MESWVGKKLGKVQIESLLGRGGVAEVYLGTHTTLERKVAVKILRNLGDESSDALERFEREARAVARLRHPNIVQVYDFDAVDNNPYLVMEYIEGPSLSKYLNALHQKKERLPLPQIARLLYAVASALQYAHKNQVIHRDVKPGNILLTSPSRHIEVDKPLPEDFEPVLTDFGLVRFLNTHRQTTTGHIAGTPAYMSPEQSRGEAADGRADVYSLGIVLYEMLAGDVPFDGESTVSILLKQVTQPPPPIPGLSPPIQNVLDRALAKDVRGRFQTPMEFADAFCAATGIQGAAATIQFDSAALPLHPQKAQKPAPPKPAVQFRTQWIRIGVLSILAIAFGILFFINNGSRSSASVENTPTGPTSSPTDTSLPLTFTDTSTAVLPVGPIGILHFRNGSAIADQATLTTQAMPAPPPGSQYEIWLTGPEGRLSLGFLVLDHNGQGELTFSDPNGRNLTSHYNGMEITIEPDPDLDPQPSGLLAFASTLPEEALAHVRYLLVTFPKTPDKSSLIQGLYAGTEQVAELAKEIESASQNGDQKAVRQKAEFALNILVGSKSPNYKDWNQDGRTEARGSYGLLLNGSNFGYIQAVYTEADYVVSIPDATEYMIVNGKVVRTCVQNMAQWAPDVQARLLEIVNSSSDASNLASIRDVVLLTDQMLHGIDLDKNGKVDAVANECGAGTAYEYAYQMADMPILPASIAYQLTQVANSTWTPTRGAQDKSENTPVVNTPASKPTKEPRPTHAPKPTKKSGGGGGGDGGNGGGKPPKKK